MRWFGQLHCHVVSGHQIADSYKHFRRRKTGASWYRKMCCGADVYKCGGADPCGGKADPYCVLSLDVGNGKKYTLGRSRSSSHTHEPEWRDEFSALIDVETGSHKTMPGVFFENENSGPLLYLNIFDDDGGGNVLYADDMLGLATVPLKDVTTDKGPKRVELKVIHPNAPPKSHDHSHANIVVEFTWFPFCGLAGEGEQTKSVPHAYFKRSHGNYMTLYHDAHCHPGDFPALPMPALGSSYEAASCWDDLSADIENAENFIFICGWSVNHAIHLKRSHQSADHGETLGEQLARKAEQGCKVVCMLWDDVTSNGLSKGGVMATYDEYTTNFFANTQVQCIKAKRYAGDDVGCMLYPLAAGLKSTSFTHHQKIVLLDGPNKFKAGTGGTGPDKRILIAYVGGLDLTSGRYDTCRHDLFNTLNTAHSPDFYNGCMLEATSDLGPREPWHDVHSRVMGPAAWDVLQTYTERLEKENPALFTEVDALLDKLVANSKLRSGTAVLIHPNDPRAWDVQHFRSLDSENAVFRNEKYLQRYANKKLHVDRTIQAAYLYHIDRAKSFIYIENQYFLGSAQYWLEHQDVPALNMIPYELTRRICRAIDDSEDFCVYILTPLYPEGVPASMTCQEILHWQYQSMRFMYAKIGEKLLEKNCTDKHPYDYLQFFFPGKKEIACAEQEIPAKATPELCSALGCKRFPIYVHSKMIIVDDELVMMGSANINDRSMAGCRDTEVTVAAMQPSQICVKDPVTRKCTLPQGDVACYRLQLWHEHFGQITSEMYNPSSVQCARRIAQMAEDNWQCFAAECGDKALPYGHACRYPHDCDAKGNLTPDANIPNIPGTSAPTAGLRSAMLPGALTT